MVAGPHRNSEPTLLCAVCHAVVQDIGCRECGLPLCAEHAPDQTRPCPNCQRACLECGAVIDRGCGRCMLPLCHEHRSRGGWCIDCERQWSGHMTELRKAMVFVGAMVSVLTVGLMTMGGLAGLGLALIVASPLLWVLLRLPHYRRKFELTGRAESAYLAGLGFERLLVPAPDDTATGSR